jgi:protein-disulfide isomerase
VSPRRAWAWVTHRAGAHGAVRSGRGTGGLQTPAVLLLLLVAGSLAACGENAPWIQPPTEGVARALDEAMGPFPLPPGQVPQEPVNVTALGYDQGSPTARISVVEFSDFGCGYCRRFHEATYPVLKAEFIDTGKVRWKYVPFAIGMFPNGSEAALAGDCAGAQGNFDAMSARLYGTQGEWRSTREPFNLFTGFAREMGLDADRFAACLLDPQRHARLEASNNMASRLGVRGTPTFFVQGQPVQGAIPLEMFREILSRMVEEAGGEE